MKITTATEAKNRLGKLLQAVQLTPFAIEKNGRKIAVILSSEAYDELVNANLRKGRTPRENRLTFTAIGSSKRNDIAENHESLLWTER